MCGLAALFALEPLSSRWIRQMLDKIPHRGPDGQGLESFAEGAFWLGHQRLSIIDLSDQGAQPMSYAQGRFWLVFNGEIYNYLELRTELSALGHQFVSQSDTEVILAAYAEWGPACTQRFNGMWALILVDTEKQHIWLSRDRFGIKPLYFWVSPGQFLAVASEIKQFTALPGWRARLNGQRAWEYLNWSITDHTAETLFEGVFQLRGGEDVFMDWAEIPQRIHQQTLPVRRWYHLPEHAAQLSLDEASEKFLFLLKEAVRLRLRADVPVASCLSGGLDSSAIVALMSQLRESNLPLHSFSACSHQAAFDESDYARLLAEQYQTQAHYLYPDTDALLGKLNDLIWFHDEPFGSASSFARWEIFSAAHAENLKVMLNGQGADEQLGGYHRLFGHYYAGLLLRGQFARLWHEFQAGRKHHGYGLPFFALRLLDILTPQILLQRANQYVGRDSAYSPWFDLTRFQAQALNPFAQQGWHQPGLRAGARAELFSVSLPMLLRWEDRCSMAHSVEVRLPFLDVNLVEFIHSLPDQFLIQAGTSKFVMRQALRHILPEKIRLRQDKMGFVTPEEHWLKNDLNDFFWAQYRQLEQRLNGALKPELKQHLQAVFAQQKPYSFLLWRLMNFSLWMQVFDVELPA